MTVKDAIEMLQKEKTVLVSKGENHIFERMMSSECIKLLQEDGNIIYTNEDDIRRLDVLNDGKNIIILLK